MWGIDWSYMERCGHKSKDGQHRPSAHLQKSG
ncbi:hypothetical protein BN174_680021 [Clostridioides difficile E15]|nr:hypothetical protein BN174_680021 [Clostridioides difficile E15]